jgi:hypothetical protein
MAPNPSTTNLQVLFTLAPAALLICVSTIGGLALLVADRIRSGARR